MIPYGRIGEARASRKMGSIQYSTIWYIGMADPGGTWLERYGEWLILRLIERSEAEVKERIVDAWKGKLACFLYFL